MKDIKTQVVRNVAVAPDYFQLTLLAPQYLQLARPGQFVMLRINADNQPLLRRPFGIFSCEILPGDNGAAEAAEVVHLLYKVVGSGTRLMTSLRSGDNVELLGPLGHGFSVESSASKHILVAGGVGVAALYMLAQQLRISGAAVQLLAGGRGSDDIVAVEQFRLLGVETLIATDDGSIGVKGYVTELLQRQLDGDVAVYACGPTPMLQAVHNICDAEDVPLQVSLEALMACGVGACLGCVVPGHDHSENNPHFLCTCKQGPVFAADKLAWPSQEEC